MTKASPQRRAKRAAKKTASNSNGKSLTKEEQDRVVQMDRGLAQRKVQLANIELQIEELKRQKRSIVNDLRRGVEAFNDAAKEIAEAHGIDPESTTEAWKLDLTKMQFEQVPPQA
jgi:tRNA uridine 5-carbamoylmethylation protein Kti12